MQAKLTSEKLNIELKKNKKLPEKEKKDNTTTDDKKSIK